MKEIPNKEQFAAYVRVQYLGLWNMFTPEARQATGLSKDTYISVMEHYSELAEKYQEVIKEAEAK